MSPSASKISAGKISAGRNRAAVVSAGVLVTDGARLLLGHATRSPRWDVPKGIAEPGEALAAAAARELAEETGLAADPGGLADLGRHRYLPGKDLALFAWRADPMPDPAMLVCRSTFQAGASVLPEFDRFGIFAWDAALGLVGKSLARVLASIGPGALRLL